MATDVRAEAVIERPCDEVAAYAFDWRNDPVWIGGIREARLVTKAPFGVGAQVERVASFLGRRIEYVNEVVELGPSKLVMRSVKSPFPMRVTYELEDAGSAARFGIRVEGDATGLYRLAEPVLSRAVRRAISGDCRRLKGILEARPPGPPA